MCPPQLSHLYQSNRVQLGHAPIPQASHHNPRVDLIPESGAISDLASEPLPLPGLDAFPRRSISERAYQEAKRSPSRNAQEIQASMAVIQEPTMNRSLPTLRVDDRSTNPATSCHAHCGVYGFAELSMSGQGASSLHSPHQNEESPSLNLQPADHHVTIPSSIASSQVSPADEILWCRDCGVSFSQRQGLNRHNRDKHSPRNICSLCGVFVWSSGRKYLFIRHLRRHHPGAVMVPLA